MAPSTDAQTFSSRNKAEEQTDKLIAGNRIKQRPKGKKRAEGKRVFHAFALDQHEREAGESAQKRPGNQAKK